jgi:hypothetical protein
MKSTQKVTRVKLNIDQNNDYILLGIVSSEADYKLSLSLNKKFRISLKNISPVRIIADNKSELTFSRFSNNVTPADFMFCLVSNRSGKNYLLNKLKNIDYLFQIQNPDTVTAVFNIDLNSIKDKNLNYLTQ